MALFTVSLIGDFQHGLETFVFVSLSVSMESLVKTLSSRTVVRMRERARENTRNLMFVGDPQEGLPCE